MISSSSKEISTVLKNGGEGPHRSAKDLHFSPLDAEEYLFYTSEARSARRCRQEVRLLMIRAHKIRLHPTEEQKHYFAKATGTARFVWNWALSEWNRQYQAGGKPTALALKKQFNAIRRE